MLDKRMPPRDECVLRDAIDRRAREIPDQPCAVFADGSALTYRELRAEVRDCAQGLRRLGVAQGDFLVVWLPSGRACLTVMLALNYLGAVYVPINTSYRGGLLAHVIDNSGARLMIADAGLVERLRDVSRAELPDVVVVGEARDLPAGLNAYDESALFGDGGALPPPEREIQP